MPREIPDCPPYPPGHRFRFAGHDGHCSLLTSPAEVVARIGSDLWIQYGRPDLMGTLRPLLPPCPVSTTVEDDDGEEYPRWREAPEYCGYGGISYRVDDPVYVQAWLDGVDPADMDDAQRYLDWLRYRRAVELAVAQYQRDERAAFDAAQTAIDEAGRRATCV